MAVDVARTSFPFASHVSDIAINQHVDIWTALIKYKIHCVFYLLFLESQHSRNDLALCTDTASVTTAIETLTKADYADLFVHGDPLCVLCLRFE